MAFQAVNDGLERSYALAVNYRFELRNRMSHELRTPLFGIVAASEILKRVINIEGLSLLKTIEICAQTLVVCLLPSA